MPRPSPATSQPHPKLQAGRTQQSFHSTADPGRKAKKAVAGQHHLNRHGKEIRSRLGILGISSCPKGKGKVCHAIIILPLVLALIPGLTPPLRALRVKPPGRQGRAKTRSEKVGCRLVAAKNAPGMTDRCILRSGHFRLPHICRYLGGGCRASSASARNCETSRVECRVSRQLTVEV